MKDGIYFMIDKNNDIWIQSNKMWNKIVIPRDISKDKQKIYKLINSLITPISKVAKNKVGK